MDGTSRGAFERSGWGAWIVATVVLVVACAEPPPPAPVRPEAQRRRASRHAAPPAVEAPPCLERCRDLRSRLRDGDFDGLDRYFVERQTELEADCGQESHVHGRYRCFATSDLSLAPWLDQWAETRPGSWAARVARGEFYQHVAFLHRSERFASEVSEKQWARYRSDSERAAADFQAAIALKPDLSIAYAGLLGVEGHHRDRELYEQALALAPWSYEARRSYLWFLQPKWGGSFEAMEAVVADADAHVDENPKLESLRDVLVAARAEVPWQREDYAAAEQILSAEIERRPSHYLLYQRGWLRMLMGSNREALEDLERARPEMQCSNVLLTMEARAYLQFQDGSNARPLLEVAAELDPLDTEVRDLLALLNYRDHRWPEALADLRVVTTYDPRNARAWSQLALGLVHFGQPEEAEAAFTRAIEAGDTHPALRYARGRLRYLARQESAFDDLRAFVDGRQEVLAEPLGNSDPKAELAWAEKVLAAQGEARWKFKDSVPK